MGKGKKFGGLGIGLVLSTVAGLLLAKKKSNIFDAMQKKIRKSFGNTKVVNLLHKWAKQQGGDIKWISLLDNYS